MLLKFQVFKNCFKRVLPNLFFLVGVLGIEPRKSRATELHSQPYSSLWISSLASCLCCSRPPTSAPLPCLCWDHSYGLLGKCSSTEYIHSFHRSFKECFTELFWCVFCFPCVFLGSFLMYLLIFGCLSQKGLGNWSGRSCSVSSLDSWLVWLSLLLSPLPVSGTFFWLSCTCIEALLLPSEFQCFSSFLFGF